MTDNPARAFAGDCRRGAAIAVHYANHSVEGINAIVAEANELKRGIELPAAVQDVLDQAAQALLTTRGLLTLHAAFRIIAANNHNPWHLPAQYLVGLIDQEMEPVGEVLNAFKDGQGTNLILGILKIYEDAVALMFAPPSIEAFQATAAAMFAVENGTDK